MIKKIRNLIGSLLLVAAIAVTQIPVTDVEAVTTASASDFQMDGTTLVKYKGTAQDVSVSNYVEKIESEAFAGNDEVKHITVGESVKSIGARAFADCANLESVTIPDSVESIDTAAFAGCPLLKEVSIGKGLKTLGNGAFSGDYSLADVAIDSSNPKFTCNEGAIYNKDGLDTLYQVLAGRKGDSYVMPASVSSIKPYAFWGDYNLQKVSISSNVKDIPGYCFSTCKNLKDVALPYSVSRIDMKAFEDCVRLRNITIPPSVKTIHSTAFDGCTKLSIDAQPGSEAEKFAQTLVLDDIDVSEYEEAPIPNQNSVSENSTGGDSGEQESGPVDYYHEVTHMNPMEQDAEDGTVKGVTRIIGQQAFVMIDNSQATINVGDTGDVIGGTPEGVSIPAQAYYDNAMESATFPADTERIGEFSFARSRLKSVKIPDGVKQIGYGAFYHCDKLEKVTIPNSVESIESFAFAKTPWMESWLHQVGSGSNFLIVGDGILLAYRGNSEQVTIPDTVKQIGPDVFREHNEITQVTIPDSTTIIGEAAFMDCASLTSVQGMKAVQEIRDRAFAGCPIRNVHIPASVKEMGLRAYDCIGTDKQIADTAVVFDGTKLPALAYGTAATKLYHDNYRGYSLAGNAVAVIRNGVNVQEQGKDTVLEQGQMGFDGTVCRIDREPEGDTPGALQVLWKNGGSDLTGRTFYLDGKAYEVQSGQTTGPVVVDERQSVMEQQTQENVEQEQTEAATITVIAGSQYLPEQAGVTANVEGLEGSYTLNVKDSDTAKREIQKVYKGMYGDAIPAGLEGFELQFTEEKTGIPITSLGKMTMDVSMPVPEGLDPDTLHILCLNTDGLLRELDHHITTKDDAKWLQFTTKHFPYYVMYSDATSTEEVVAQGQTQLSEGRMTFSAQGQRKTDAVSNQKTYWKWALAGGLFLTAMAVFFVNGNLKLRKLKLHKKN